MKIWISSLRDVHEAHRLSSPARVVSLLSPGSDFPSFDGYAEDRHIRVGVHDILEDRENQPGPGAAHVDELIAFLSDWSPEEPLLVHCWAGMSRSTATAMIAAAIHSPKADEAAIGEALAAASPTAFPNTRLVALADDKLGREGRLAAAAQRIRDDEARLAVIYETVESSPFHIPARF